MSFVVEVVCYCIEDVYRAYKGGAKRVELCADPSAGGTTPNYGLIKQSVELFDLDVMVMIRPRGGDFLYTKAELSVMKEDIKMGADLGAKGVVFGILDQNACLDVGAMANLVQLAKDLELEVTCHRAFDVARNPRAFLAALMEMGVDRLLTSGQGKTAVEGFSLLAKLIEQAQDRLIIMPGGGVRPSNIHKLLELNITEIHTGSNIKVPSKMVLTGQQDTQSYHNFVDVEAVRTIVEATESLGGGKGSY